MTLVRSQGWAWTRAALRVATGVQALFVMAQAALAGQLLTGNDTAREWHRELGTELITWMAFVSLILAVLAWKPGRYRAWPIAVTGLGMVAVILQLGYGFDRRLDLHIPLGLVIFALYLTVLIGVRSDTSDREDQT